MENSGKRKRGRPKGSKKKKLLSIILPDPSPSQSLPNAADSSASSSEPSTPAPEDKFEQAAAEVLAESGAGESGPAALTSEQLGPDFEKMVRAYLPKPFQIAALLLEDEKLQLSDIQTEMLVPQGALCLEELWPYLPEFFKTSKFKHTYAFMLSFSLIAGPNVIAGWKTFKEKQSSSTTPQPSTVTAA